MPPERLSESKIQGRRERLGHFSWLASEDLIRCKFKLLGAGKLKEEEPDVVEIDMIVNRAELCRAQYFWREYPFGARVLRVNLLK